MIIEQQRTVYYAPERGRAYLTLWAACLAEARTIINIKYPDVEPDVDDGRMTSPGWMFKHDNEHGGLEYYERLERKFAKLIQMKFRNKRLRSAAAGR